MRKGRGNASCLGIPVSGRRRDAGGDSWRAGREESIDHAGKKELTIEETPSKDTQSSRQTYRQTDKQ